MHDQIDIPLEDVGDGVGERVFESIERWFRPVSGSVFPSAR